ncbi:toxin co-regulated pilus biosynthesis Q family protein [Paraburkholderia sp. BL10I2N1]|uniref:toxin co-regulated pilus biosynthesis Q family protein n=1 Tax=Paraburkholderia sp. BL10I2N1 TaxID=1938796 RepID=UPI00105D165F|nr:toxin co-regulated pilus biosynthesis Q family protein [Paraburkholderia sp. BL10I2N1]TDN59097.1 toxin co-regulated pilus biosynthesis protein Q [Paraburkholderia sp. BL10I2N1]
MNVTIPTHQRTRAIVQVLAAVALVCVTSVSNAAIDPEQSGVVPLAGDGWQILAPALAPAKPVESIAQPAVPATPSAAPALPVTIAATLTLASTPMGDVPDVLPGAPSGSASALTLTVTPQDVNLRDALDRWLQKQGWQLAWKIDDDLPLEFNATFSGEFTSVLEQVMQATNHMRTPTRVCRHTNNVIRVIARAANCKD